MKAVILAAGEGTRLLPLTEDAPKIMLPVAGRPMLEVTLSSLRAAGIREALLIVKNHKEQIMEYFADGSRLGMKINYADQGETLGTAHAISKAEGFIDDAFLVTHADEVTSAETFQAFLKTPEQKIGARHVDNPERYGVIEESGGSLINIEEKPESPKSTLVNAGLYIFSTTVFDYIKKTPRSPCNEYEMTDTIRMMLADGGKFAVDVLKGYRRDVGSPWQLLEVNEAFMKGLKHDTHGEVESGAVLKKPVHVGKGSVVRSGSYIQGPVFIGKNCEIGPHAYLRPYTVIMDNCHVGRAEVKNSILMHGTKCGHVSYIGDSVVGRDCNFGAGAVVANLRHNDQNVKMMVKDKLVDTGRRKLGCVMGSESKTGVNSTIMPGVKVGSHCVIGPNAIVYKDLQSNTKLVIKQEAREGE